MSEPNYYIFVTNNVGWETEILASHVVETLAAHEIWLISSRTPYRKFYKPGDHVLLYVAGKGARHFAGKAEIAGPLTEATEADIRLAEELNLEGFNGRLPLKSIVLWKEPVPISLLIESLSFIKDKKNYGLHFRQAAARIEVNDYNLILSQADSKG